MTEVNKDTIIDILQKKKAVQIMDIVPDTVSELKEIKFKKNTTPKQRVLSLLEQTDNPYVYRDGGVMVKVSFANNGRTLQSCMQEYLTAEILMNR